MLEVMLNEPSPRIWEEDTRFAGSSPALCSTIGAIMLYYIWWLFGGWYTEKQFIFLSNSILENRQRIYELNAQVRVLKSKVGLNDEISLEDWENKVHNFFSEN